MHSIEFLVQILIRCVNLRFAGISGYRTHASLLMYKMQDVLRRSRRQ